MKAGTFGRLAAAAAVAIAAAAVVVVGAPPSGAAGLVVETSKLYREDALADFATCIENQSCTDTMADCLAECVPTSTHESYEAHCRAKLAECGVTSTQVCETMASAGADDSEVLCLLAPSVIEELDACFSLDCAAISNCVQGFVAKYGFSV